MEQRCGAAVKFRVCETPCFFPRSLLDHMAEYGRELIHQLDGPEYRKVSDQAIPPEFNTPNEAPHTLFAQVDFGLVRGTDGQLQPQAGGASGLSLALWLPAGVWRRCIATSSSLTEFELSAGRA